MDWEESLKEFEKLAVLLQNNCFEKLESKRLKANYEIRSLVVIELQGASLLCYGDKSGSTWIINRETYAEIHTADHQGVIDILDYKIIPGNQALLFAVVRNEGIFEYRIRITGNEIKCEVIGKIAETNGYIRFFYPHIVINPDNAVIRSEIWVSLDNGAFLVFKNKDLNNNKTWQLKQQLDLPYALRAYAVDIDPGKPDEKGCFFIGNSVGDIFCLEFDTIGMLKFPASQEELEEQRVLTIHGAFFEKMIPLSDYREGPAKNDLFYKDFYGCLALTRNKVICIYFKKESGKEHLHTSTKVFPNQLIDIKCLPFDEFCWTAVSDNKKKLHFIKNVTDMNPPGRKLELIYDGEFSVVEFEDRIFNLCIIPASTEKKGLEYLGYLGMGNHSVVPIVVYDYKDKLNEAIKLFAQIVKENETSNIVENESIEPLNIIEKILNYSIKHPSRTAVKLLLLNLMKGITPKLFSLTRSNHFARIFYKIVDNEGTDLIQRTCSFLLRLEKPLPELRTAINEFHTHIKKYILDGLSYSKKTDNLKELWEYNEKTGNLVDAIVYRGILYDRQYDPMAHFQFDKDREGEITRVVPFIPFNGEKFIISTSKGKLFLADFQSMADKRPLLEYKKNIPGPEKVLKINNLYISKKKVFIFLSDPVIIVKNISELEAAAKVIEVNDQDKCCIRFMDEKIGGTSVCRMPWDEEKSDDCFVGTNQGNIFYLDPQDLSIKQVIQSSMDQASILDLRSFSAGGRYFLAAACRNGKIKIYECDRHNLSSIVHIIDIPVDTNAVTRLLALCKEGDNLMEYPLLVAGTEGGKCFGIRLLISTDPNEKMFKFIYEWCYRTTEKAVKGIHPFTLEKGHNFILISSMDSYLHILDFNGLCFNTIKFESPLLQVFMENFPDKLEIDLLPVYRNAYVITMDNNLQKMRFFIKSKIFNEIQECFSGQRLGYEKINGNKEVLLLKFKTIAIREPHFRTRYYLNSNEFFSADRLLAEIEQILDHGKAEKDHDALVDLIRRLFRDFFDEILQAHEKYTALKKLFLKTRDQWGYPGSRENTRAQLYWIRSMLKWCCQSENKTPIERLNQWFVTGKKVANGSGILELDSIQILQHFIIHPVPFLRVKTIQYFQKFIFSLKKEKGPIEKLIFDDELVKTMSNSVISVLKMYRTEPGEGSPSWFEMEAVRFFAWMILNYRYTGLCPARLCYDIWESNISSTFPFRLADFIQICPKGLEDKIEISKMLHAAGQLMQKMKRENSQVIEILPELMRFCQSCRNHTLEEEKCPCKNNFGHEFAQFFTAIEKLLSLTKIEHFKNTPNFNEVLGLTLNYFKGKGIIEAFARLSRYLSQYYHEKSQDIYYLNVIKFPTFYQVKKSLENIRDMIDKSQKKTSWLENALYNRIWIQWHNILKNELDNGLILDFANAIQYYKDTQLIDNESIDMELIFKNIFTRLNMMAECDRSYLIYIEKKNNQLVILHNDGENEFTLSNKSYQLKDMPLEWLEPDTFIVLAENDIKQYINGNHAHIFIKSPGIVPQKNNALYLVFWNRINDTGLSRLKSHEIIGEFITTVALLQVAMEEQREQKEEFFRIVSHELNQIIRGLLSWMSNLTAGYLEDDPAMRLEYYERFQSSLVAADHVIRSLLTFRDSSVFDIKACYLDKEIEQVVKNARVQYKDYGNITLNFHKETGDYEIITEPALVGTAIMNLLTNSRKYNPEKNPVNLMLKTVDQKIVIEVKDEGIGIPPSDYPFIFQLFKRGSLAVKKNIDGLGVGLAISKKNIESLGGVIDFDSKVGVGTTFRIILNKRKFDKRHLLVTRVTVKKAPDFSAVKDIEKRKKFLEKVEYNPNKNILILRGILTDEEYNDLKMCYLDDEKTKEFHLEALQKLHRESLFNLNKITTIK